MQREVSEEPTMALEQVAILAVVAATLALILIRPRGVSEAWIAAGGAILMLLVSPLTAGDLPDVLHETADVLLFLAGMMALTIIVEQAGVFAHLAEATARLARGNGILLFCNVFLLGAVVTALLSLDVTVIMLTPIIYLVAKRRGLDPLPFMFACTFVANTASLVLPISNLTNLLVYHDLGISFARFASVMWWPNLAAAVTNLLVFLVLFRKRIPRTFAITSDDPLPPTGWWFKTASLVLVASLLALFALGLAGKPLAPAAIGGAALLLVIGLLGGRMVIPPLIRDFSWQVLVFVVGMFLVVRGVEIGVIAQWDLPVPGSPTGALIYGSLVSTVGSNIVNNVPMTLLMMSLFPRVDGATQEALAYGTLLGANIGPTLTTYGSLATMLWLTVVRKRGITITTRDYLTIGALTMPPVLIASMIALWLVL
jgi:arsenical pump membrane protein